MRDEPVKVEVEIIGLLRKYFERHCECVELPEGATAADLLSHLRPPPWLQRGPLLIVVNQRFAEPSTFLVEGDRVIFMLPVGGG
jgi:molybdopterin converting factor small subunit